MVPAAARPSDERARKPGPRRVLGTLACACLPLAFAESDQNQGGVTRPYCGASTGVIEVGRVPYPCLMRPSGLHPRMSDTALVSWGRAACERYPIEGFTALPARPHLPGRPPRRERADRRRRGGLGGAGHVDHDLLRPAPRTSR